MLRISITLHALYNERFVDLFHCKHFLQDSGHGYEKLTNLRMLADVKIVAAIQHFLRMRYRKYGYSLAFILSAVQWHSRSCWSVLARGGDVSVSSFYRCYINQANFAAAQTNLSSVVSACCGYVAFSVCSCSP